MKCLPFLKARLADPLSTHGSRREPCPACRFRVVYSSAEMTPNASWGWLPPEPINRPRRIHPPPRQPQNANGPGKDRGRSAGELIRGRLPSAEGRRGAQLAGFLL